MLVTEISGLYFITRICETGTNGKGIISLRVICHLKSACSQDLFKSKGGCALCPEEPNQIVITIGERLWFDFIHLYRCDSVSHKCDVFILTFSSIAFKKEK